MKRVLLVEPAFPIASKSRNHKNFLPVGLLKIASYLRHKGVEVQLVRGTSSQTADSGWLCEFDPDEVWVTSLFTYWAPYVRDTVQFYKEQLPDARVVVGGIYASLFPREEVRRYTGCDEVYQGIMPEAEDCLPAYDLVDGGNPQQLDYQIVHASRGCPRRCSFCGTWIVEPEFNFRSSVKDLIRFKKVVFYDNNLLANPHIEKILSELTQLRDQGKLTWCESQSGFDGRILLTRPHLAKMLREAGFRYPRIAWDWSYSEYPSVEQQVRLLRDAGYPSKDIYVFILYNWDIPFDEVERKRLKCWEWQVQIADCRFRPLTQLHDNYNPCKIGQSEEDYYIHRPGGWSDALVKQFRKNVRQQNICVRHGFPFYSKALERKSFDAGMVRQIKGMDTGERLYLLKSLGVDFWLPSQTRYPPALSDSYCIETDDDLDESP